MNLRRQKWKNDDFTKNEFIEKEKKIPSFKAAFIFKPKLRGLASISVKKIQWTKEHLFAKVVLSWRRGEAIRAAPDFFDLPRGRTWKLLPTYKLGWSRVWIGAKKGAIKCADGELRRNQNFGSNASAGPEVEAQLFVLELAAHAIPGPKQLVRKTSISASKNREIDRMIGPNPSGHRKEFGDKKWDPWSEKFSGETELFSVFGAWLTSFRRRSSCGCRRRRRRRRRCTRAGAWPSKFFGPQLNRTFFSGCHEKGKNSGLRRKKNISYLFSLAWKAQLDHCEKHHSFGMSL